MPTGTMIRASARVRGFTYAIRNIVVEAKKVEAAGTTRALPEHRRPDSVRVQDAAASDRGGGRAMRDGHNGYTASAGIESAREAVAAEYRRRAACRSRRIA